jgi:hypothetical protein
VEDGGISEGKQMMCVGVVWAHAIQGRRQLGAVPLTASSQSDRVTGMSLDMGLR